MTKYAAECLGGGAGITYDAHRDSILLDGEELDLDRSSRWVLLALAQAEGFAVAKQDLLQMGWPDRIVHENSLAKAIGRIRAALGEDGKRLEAVYGRGYRLIPRPRPQIGGSAPRPADDEATGQGPFADGASRPDAREPAAAPPPGDFAASLEALEFPTTDILPTRDVPALSHAPASGRRKGRLALLGIGLLALVGAAALRLFAPSHAHSAEDDPEELIHWLSSDILAKADPYNPAPDSTPLRNAIERTAQTMDTRFAGRPDTLVALHRIIANAFSGWGEYQKAVFHLDAAAKLERAQHGTDTLVYGKIASALCQQLRLGGRTERAQSVCETAVEIDTRLDSPDLPAAKVAQGKLFFETGDYTQASQALEETLRTDKALQPEVEADANWFLGLSERKLGHFEQADTAFRRNLDLRRKTLGEDHPLTAWALADYAEFLVTRGQFARAEPMLKQARAIFVGTLGPNHPEALSPLYSLAVLRLEQDRPAEARDLLAPILAKYRDALGSDHFWTLYTMAQLALADAQTGETTRAESLLEEAHAIAGRALYGHDGKAAQFHLLWAHTWLELGKLDAAKGEIDSAQDGIAKAFAQAPQWQARLHCLSARLARKEGRAREATHEAGLCRKSLEAAHLPASYPLWADTRHVPELSPPHAGHVS